MVTLGPAGEADALDHVRIERALGEEVGAADLLRLGLENVDEQPPMNLRFFSGSLTPLRPARNISLASTWTSGML
jgi:hypothetical protein